MNSGCCTDTKKKRTKREAQKTIPGRISLRRAVGVGNSTSGEEVNMDDNTSDEEVNMDNSTSGEEVNMDNNTSDEEVQKILALQVWQG